MKTALELTPQELADYRQMAKVRWQQEQKDLSARREHAWKVVRHAARLLKEKYGATRVVVFGSLVHEGCFTRWSDIDIAAWGLCPEETFRAIGEVMDLDSEIEVNLIDAGACRPSFLAIIESEGIDLD